MIYTVTLNPAVDYVVHIDDFQPGSVNRSTGDYKYPGGKGINVSRVLKRLGTENTALGFLGGFTGQFIEDTLNEEGISHDFVHVQGDTRINVKLKTEQETEINGQSPGIHSEDIKNFQNKCSQLKSGDTIVLAGSVPSSLPTQTYKTLMEPLVEQGVSVYLDTSGQALNEALKARPSFIKPNHEELAELYATTVDSVSTVVELAKQLQRDYDIEHVLVSMAGEGAVYVGHGEILHATPPSGTVVNSVGAGDSSVAGFLSRYEETEDVKEALRYAIAAGSATAFSPTFCTREDVEKFVQEIHVKTLES